jgi:hypothetical protein
LAEAPAARRLHASPPFLRATAATLSEIAKLLQAGRLKTRVGGVILLACVT